MKWSRPDAALFEAWRGRARESILEVNDGIVSAAGIAEGFASVGASLRTLLLAGTSVTLAGGLAAAGARYTEVRTEWEMNRALIDAERASILADPAVSSPSSPSSTRRRVWMRSSLIRSRER